MEESSQPKPAHARRPWTDEDQLRAEEMQAQGLSLRAIGRALGLSHARIHCRLDSAFHQREKERRRTQYAADPGKQTAASRRYYAANAESLREYARNYRRSNIDSCLERSRAYYKANRERCNARKRLWAKANPEKVAISQRKADVRYKAANPGKARERARSWRKANSDKAREGVRRQNARRRAGRRRALVPISLSGKNKRYALFLNRCAYCGATGDSTADHVLALKRGGMDEASNIVPACFRCNASKQDSPVEQWYSRQPFFTEARWQKIQHHCPGVAAGQLPLAFAVRE